MSEKQGTQHSPSSDDAGKEKPDGGHDKTPLKPSSGTTYTVKITFHSASNLPVSDLPSMSSDPYVHAQLDVPLTPRHKEDPKLRFRSNTLRRTLEPSWEAEWIVAGIPASGFMLQTRIYDEDPENHDDQLGTVTLSTGSIKEGWRMDQKEFKMKKSGASLRAYGMRWVRKMTCRGTDLHATLILSIEVVGKTDKEVGMAYTFNNFWWVHFSPMIGKLVAGTKAEDDKGIERSDFQANELQLRGPVPPELYHRYVDFKPFVKGMFTATGVRGRLLHKALHHQHERIYTFNKTTKHGTFDEPGREMTLQFLDMVHYDTGGRLFTYVITLDGMFRFTETGKEFGIDLLSKHTMHSDVQIYIAWSGEFLVRRLAKADEGAEAPDQQTHPADDLPDGPPKKAAPKDPKRYELVIDNDSGTYRPDASLLPILKKFLQSNFPDLHIVVKDCEDKELARIKKDQTEAKKREGDHRVYALDAREREDHEQTEERGRTAKEKVFAGIQDPKAAVRNYLPGSHRKKMETKADEGAEGYEADHEGVDKVRRSSQSPRRSKGT